MSDSSAAGEPIFGLAEGYYGRLLDWSERHGLLENLAAVGGNTWLYAPKDDARHRLFWREPYDSAWLTAFQRFCRAAGGRGVDVIAGVAPGLDYDFRNAEDSADFAALVAKSRSLLAGGAARICLLMDDIDADFERRSGDFRREGEAHAWLANALSDAIDASLDVVPRIYAHELMADAPDYLADALATLAPGHRLLHCGPDIVARRPDAREIRQRLGSGDRRLIVWDNLYANDYCPRRLFLGPWSGREAVGDVLVNPTGLAHTDALLLSLAAATLRQTHAAHADSAAQTDVDAIAVAVWQEVLEEAAVPLVFRRIAAAFWQPFCNGDQSLDPGAGLPRLPDDALNPRHHPDRWLQALDELLWRWKSPLAREWYPWLMGARQDVLFLGGKASPLRIKKTQPLLQQALWLSQL